MLIRIFIISVCVVNHLRAVSDDPFLIVVWDFKFLLIKVLCKLSIKCFML